MEYPYKTLRNSTCYRIIPSRFPPISLFEDVASQDEFDALFYVQSLTNPRIQDQIGNINRIPEQDRVFGVPGCGYIMAAFTHINPDGSRFSNGDFGIYYASLAVPTAVAETVYHRARFLSFTQEPAQDLDMRLLQAQFNADLLDISNESVHEHPFYHLESYQSGQLLGAQVRQAQGDGIYYTSVRDHKGTNVALFKPRILAECKQASHYIYRWSGKAIVGVFEASAMMV